MTAILAQKGLPVTSLAAVGNADAGAQSGIGTQVAIPNYLGPRSALAFQVDVILNSGTCTVRSIVLEGSNDGGVTWENITTLTDTGSSANPVTNVIFALVRPRLTVFTGTGNCTVRIVV